MLPAESAGSWTAAEPLLLAGDEDLAKHADDRSARDQRFVRQALERVVQFHADWGQADKAARWQQRLDELKKSGIYVRPANKQP